MWAQLTLQYVIFPHEDIDIASHYILFCGSRLVSDVSARFGVVQ